jgi:hypothetical protein
LSVTFDFDIFQAGIRLKSELKMKVHEIEIRIKPGEYTN